MRHVPVLAKETLSFLTPAMQVLFDGTLGHAGHTQLMLKHYAEQWKKIRMICTDRDEKMIAKARAFLGDLDEQVEIVQWSYADRDVIHMQTDIEKVDFMLLDLGVNMDHFKVAERWFSIKMDGALDMRYDTSTGQSASQRLQTATFQEIKDALTDRTDFSSRFVDRIVEQLLVDRRKRQRKTTQELVSRGNTQWMNDKTLAIFFQAIRIAVNHELEELQNFLQCFPKWLNTWGRCVVITYHSGEDRLVKQAFKWLEEQHIWTILTKHVITPTWHEIQQNKAARSAKLRAFELLSLPDSSQYE